ncbi:FAD-dependent oxidoreductase [Xanthomonas euvesicatoria pv. alangii]|uniref:FAD-dependent oxidoreductase n=1 Tax=Xanthomonas euvesicatoria TaxID=456327 RepID=UPI001C449E3F|nr:FAD-dependent oxidoreductase [Xanthomonas euvesicatoria]MBV6667950.1 FAD-dependent oxidoreductase [Xanthomonas euvesicatoria pv. alangii]
MRGKHIAVLGGSIAGLTSTLAFARSGARVTLIERDAVDAALPSGAAGGGSVDHGWRKGVPHARHTHALAALGRRTLRERAPDVWSALIAAGAIEMPFGAQLQGLAATPRCDDPDLFGLSVRRAFVETVLRPIVLAEPNVTVLAQTAVSGLLVGGEGIAMVHGVQTGNGEVRADLTIDALGRGSALCKWLRTAGAAPPSESVENCGLAYYTRWYHLIRRPTVRLDAGFSAGGYAATSGCIVCPADNDYASITLMVPQGDKALHAFDAPELFTAVARQHVGIAAWLQPGVCEPVSDVLRWPVCENRFRHFMVDGQPVVLGVVAVGDALCTTNPTYTRGMSLAMRHAFALADLVQQDGLDDPHRFAAQADALVQQWIRPWHDDSVMQDRTRSALWAGTPSPPPQGQITLQHISAAARHDAVVWQALARRTGMLAPPDAIFARADVLARVRALGVQPMPPSQPGRDALLQLIDRHRSANCVHPPA